jgi:transcriptional regulator with XRE-family HTH domain
MNNNDLFNELKEIRLRKGISLEELSEESKIQLKYLEALESGDLLKIPEVYDKLFFRAYLKYLGLNEDEFYDRFLEYRKKLRVDKTTTVINFAKSGQSSGKFNLTRNILVIIPLVIVVLVIWLLIQNTQIISSVSDKSVEEINIQSVVQEFEQQPTMYDDTTKADSTKLKVLNLKIRGLKNTWFRVIIDKRDTLEYLLPKGNQISLQANELYEFLIGRADGLQLEVNDRKLGRIGTDSTVIRYMRIDSTGIAAKILKTQ